MKIGDFDLNQEVLVVAEIGNCHEGSLSLAEDLMGLAAKAGAGAVKFQTIVPEKLVSSVDKDRIEQLKKFRLTHEQFERLHKLAQKEKVLFLSTPFDVESVRFLEPLVPAFKIASGDNNFFPLIDTIVKTRKPIILSSGLTDLDEIKLTVDHIKKMWARDGICQDLAVLHCVVNYPTELKDANLKAIEALKTLDVTVGYSDHTIGMEAAVLAVCLGARIVEKHFTVNKNHSSFRDHQMAADPKEMAELVARIKQVQIALGDGTKRVMDCEKENRLKVRRSIAAGRDLKKGCRIQEQDLTWVRPGHGWSPGEEKQLVGRVLAHDLKEGEIILESDVENRVPVSSAKHER